MQKRDRDQTRADAEAAATVPALATGSDAIGRFDAYSGDIARRSKFGRAQLVGGVSAFLAAMIWAWVCYITELRIGYLAIGLGLMVGAAIRYLCNPVGVGFALLAGANAFLGCLIGNLWMIGLIMTEGKESFFSLIAGMDYLLAFQVHLQMFDGHDIAFYAISIGAALRIAYMKPALDVFDFMLMEKGVAVHAPGDTVQAVDPMHAAEKQRKRDDPAPMRRLGRRRFRAGDGDET